MEIDERKVRILQAIINDYITTGDPVGSRTIAKKYNLGISPATIRNEMADLEDMGYLEQIHTSSGRKPSDKGYRLYVDKIMKDEPITAEEENIIKRHLLDKALFEVDKTLKQAMGLLSELTRLTCVLGAPSVQKSRIKSIQLMRIDSNAILLVMVTDNSIVKNNIIRMAKVPTNEALAKIAYSLNVRIKNLTIEQINLEVINNIKSDLQGHDDIFNAVVPALYDILKESSNIDVYQEGAANIFYYPEYNDIEKAREFLSLISSKENVRDLLTEQNGITVKIGKENFIPEAQDCSIISASYKIGGKPLGSIALIGPTRIPYSKVVSIMAKVMQELNDVLGDNTDY